MPNPIRRFLEIDLSDFASMYDLAVLAQRLDCDIRCLIINALIISIYRFQGEVVPAKLNLEGIVFPNPDELGVDWCRAGILQLADPFVTFLGDWSKKEFNETSLRPEDLVKKSIDSFLEMTRPELPTEEEEGPNDPSLSSNEFLLSSKSEMVISVLAKNQTNEDFVRYAIKTVYRKIFNRIDLKFPAEKLKIDDNKVVVDAGFEELLDTIAEFIAAPKEMAVDIVLDFVWKDSGHAEKIIFFH